MASGGDGPESEYKLASVFYQIFNRRAADGTAYISVSSCALHALQAAPTRVPLWQMGAMHAVFLQHVLSHVRGSFIDIGDT